MTGQRVNKSTGDGRRDSRVLFTVLHNLPSIRHFCDKQPITRSETCCDRDFTTMVADNKTNLIYSMIIAVFLLMITFLITRVGVLSVLSAALNFRVPQCTDYLVFSL